jgi:hypothetical protein
MLHTHAHTHTHTDTFPFPDLLPPHRHDLAGVNDFSTPPAVPHTSPEYFGASSVFWWEDPATKSRVLAYYAASYSQGAEVPEMAVIVPGFSEALIFLFHVDNTGPQDPTQVGASHRLCCLYFSFE